MVCLSFIRKPNLPQTKSSHRMLKHKSCLIALLKKCFLPPDELEEGSTVLRYTMIWPRCELELLHFSPVCVTHLKNNNYRQEVQIG